MSKKLISFMIIFCMILSCVMSLGFSASGESVDTTDYGLAQSCEDGNILHCFNWTLNQIKAELPNIAEAGFTSVQTSPLQAHAGGGNTKWYWLYQPNGFSVLGNELGSLDDLSSLCSEADKYGIKIIVDVVANHVGGNGAGFLANSVESILKTNKNTYFHNQGNIQDYNNRDDVIYKNLGMPDLNTEHADIQNMAVDMITRLKAAGVDGIRWDAAKHIGLPSEGSDFWTKVSEVDLFQYGEILENPGAGSIEKNTPLMQEYAGLISVTDSKYSSDVLYAVRDKNKNSSDGYWKNKDISSDKIIYWGESHDTYANNTNDGGFTKNLDQNVIDKAYAIVAARAGSHALYLSRPSETDKEKIYFGVKGSTHFTSKEVAEVNRFHNAMIGTDETYLSNRNYSVISREGGAVIVSIQKNDTDVSVTNKNGMVPAGTYTDRVSGNTWTVTETNISGHIGASGIAVIYNDETPAKEFMLGDSDGNGEIESIDATLPQRDLALMEVPDYYDPDAADVDQDGEVSSLDVTYLQRWLAMIDVPYPIGEIITK